MSEDASVGEGGEIEEGQTLDVSLVAGERLDKALAVALPALSRARIQALMAEGRVTRGEAVLDDPSAKAQAGDYEIFVPAPEPAEPRPEAIPLVVLYEDADLIVMGVHGRNVVDLALFGSTTNQVVRSASCPVLTVRTAR